MNLPGPPVSGVDQAARPTPPGLPSSVSLSQPVILRDVEGLAPAPATKPAAAVTVEVGPPQEGNDSNKPVVATRPVTFRPSQSTDSLDSTDGLSAK